MLTPKMSGRKVRKFTMTQEKSNEGTEKRGEETTFIFCDGKTSCLTDLMPASHASQQRAVMLGLDDAANPSN